MKEISFKHKYTLVLAMDQKGGIGKDGKLPWKIKEEMNHFKTLTTASISSNSTTGPSGNVIIMGRKTFDSIGCKLPGRTNYVLGRSRVSSHMSMEQVDAEITRLYEQDRKTLAEKGDFQEVKKGIFVIGGSEIAKAYIDAGLIEKVYLSIVKGSFDCDVFVPDQLQNDEQWNRTLVLKSEKFDAYCLTPK
jgi:dihydrofolate reductase